MPLGEWSDGQTDFDLYYCSQGGHPTVIARYGEAGDYYSGLEFGRDGHIPALAEAYRRAVAQGHIKTVDLRTCQPGDKLKTIHGIILTYVGPLPGTRYPHQIRYPDGGYGTRTDNGQVYINNRLPSDEDVVEIMPREG